MFQNSPVPYLTQKLWKYSKGNRKSVVLYYIMFILANVFLFLQPLVIATLLNIVQENGVTQESMPRIFLTLAALPLLYLCFWMLHGPARVIENRNAFLIRANYKQFLLSGAMALPLEWHADHHSGDTIDKVEKGASALFRYSTHTFQIIEFIVKITSSYIVLVYFNVHSAYIVLAIILLALVLILRFDKVLIGQYKILYRAENKISERVFDVISNITTVIILRIEKIVAAALYKKILEPLDLFVKNQKINETKWFLTSTISALMTVLVIGSYVYTQVAVGGVVLVGTMYALYGYVEKISDLFFTFAYMYGDIVQQKSAVMNAEEVAEHFRDIKKAKPVNMRTPWKKLAIQDLSFSYSGADGTEMHLDNISLDLHKGRRIALIGASGSGKTTFLKVVRELYRPQSVKILLDNKELKHGFASISDDIALIPQDPEIFSATILENITVGVPHTPEQVQKFTDMACFSDVIERLPNGLSSNIFEKGVNLSGGEKQRLALARGLMACEDKEIILLDEPTSSVDTKNEIRIFENIFKAFKGKTIIASVHRLHLLSMFDEIAFFHRGKLLATGTFSELLASSAEFQELWEKYRALGDDGEG